MSPWRHVLVVSPEQRSCPLGQTQPASHVHHHPAPGACRLVSEYLQLAPGDLVQDAVELLSGEAVLRMVHTHAGARVGCLAAAYGSPKDRKKLAKAMKGHVLKMCLDEFAYIPLVHTLAVVDDTQLMRKCVITELAVCPPFFQRWRSPCSACGTSLQCVLAAAPCCALPRRACGAGLQCVLAALDCSACLRHLIAVRACGSPVLLCLRCSCAVP